MIVLCDGYPPSDAGWSNGTPCQCHENSSTSALLSPLLAQIDRQLSRPVHGPDLRIHIEDTNTHKDASGTPDRTAPEEAGQAILSVKRLIWESL
jgi:hypothetical protein